MKIGITANIDKIDNIPEGCHFNPIKFLAEKLSDSFEIIVFDWRDLDKNLQVKRYLKFVPEGMQKVKQEINLNRLCDTLLIRQLGKIYNERSEFLNFLGYLQSFQGLLINNLKTIKENLSKQYILDLQEKGFPVIPTLEINNKTLEEVKQLKISNKFYNEIPKDLVVKPKIFGEHGQSVKNLSSFQNEKEFEEYLELNKPIIVQPLIEEIKTSGENGLIFFNSKLIHGINKFSGDFKINFGNNVKYTKYEPNNEIIKICQNIIRSMPNKADYSRIDFIPYKSSILIGEVEMINPAFYIEDVPEVAENLIKELKILLNNKNGG